MKKKITAIILILLCLFTIAACGDKALAGTYRSVDSSTNTKYFIELYSTGKCKLYYLEQGLTEQHLDEGNTLYYGTYKYTLNKKDSAGKRTGTITITVKYEYGGTKKTETYSGKILASGNISLEFKGNVRSFKKQ